MKKQSIFIFVLIIIIPILGANTCDKNKHKNNKQPMYKNLIIDKTFDHSSNADLYKIIHADLKDSLLTITFEAQICENDQVDLVFNGNYLKSYPPKANVGLRFNPNTSCKTTSHTITFNIANIKYPNSKSTIILLKDQSPITYNH